MPAPRRYRHYATLGNFSHRVVPEASKQEMRCMRCECRLASDNYQALCSPCQRVVGGMPDLLAASLEP